MKRIKFTKKIKYQLIFSILGLISALITFKFYYFDLVGLTIPFFLFLLFSYIFGREEKFLNFVYDYFIYFFIFWLIALAILVNF